MTSKYSSFLDSYVDWTDEEISVGKKYLKWEELTVKWENVDLLWEEVFILLEVIETLKRGGSGGSMKEYMEKNPWDKTKNKIQEDLGKEKTDKFIKIICKVNGLDYEKTIKPNSEIKITTSHIEKTLQEAIKVGIKVD